MIPVYPAKAAAESWLTPEERAASRRRAAAERPEGAPFWVFGFGSLMWRPGFAPVERRAATLRGYRRRFHIWSVRARGTPEKPGLAPCLEPAPGEACRGVAFRLDEATLDADLVTLWEREQGSGVYRPTWVEVAMEDGPVTALTFVVRPDHPHYVGPMGVAETAAIIVGAEGRHGACRDYLASLIEELGRLGDRDPFLEDVLATVDGLATQARN